MLFYEIFTWHFRLYGDREFIIVRSGFCHFGLRLSAQLCISGLVGYRMMEISVGWVRKSQNGKNSSSEIFWLIGIYKVQESWSQLTLKAPSLL